MNEARIAALLSVLLCLTVACASTPSPSGAQTQAAVVPANLPGCTVIDTGNRVPWMPQTSEIMRDLKNQAVGSSGTVVFDSNTPPFRGTTYRCDPGFLPSR
jgi:hypothetical protein